MKNNKRHKYFRNLKHNQKLETRYDNGDYSIYFTTAKACPEMRKRSEMYFLSHPYVYHPIDYNRQRGHECYIYWRRPTVKYTVRECENNKSAWKQIIKKQTARRNRYLKISDDDSRSLQKSIYKRVEDIWNYD